MVTVDEAISKGHRMVNYPVSVPSIMIFGITYNLYIQYQIPTWGILVCFVVTALFAWLLRRYMIIKWQLWAFDNVRNVHELKKRAIQERLIRSNNSIFEKNSILSASDKEKLNSLKIKFNQEDFFQDDLTIANETVIYYLSSKNYTQMAIMLGCLVFGICFLLMSNSYIIGTILSIIGAYFGYRNYKEAINKEPQIIINEKGIKTISTDFYSWKEIENENVLCEGSGSHTRYFLIYDYPFGSEKLKINDYDIDQSSLNKLLIVYRGRSKMKTKNL